MSVGFRAVQWNRAKLVYDAIVLVSVALYLGGFIAIASALHPHRSVADSVDIRVQAFGSCAFLMLTVILCIGPLTRLDRRFLPLLYNRRHLGVLTFLIVCVHVW